MLPIERNAALAIVLAPGVRNFTQQMNTSLATPAAPVGADIFERILAASGGLLALDGGDTDALIDQFRALVRHSGQSVYLWLPETGLDNLREAHARVPGSQRLGQALRFVQQSIHFGVYLFRGISTPLAASELSLLRQLARSQTEQVRRVVLLDAPGGLLNTLADVLVHVDCAAKPEVRPRLRDGRWLL
jgi:hypothetical protein